MANEITIDYRIRLLNGLCDFDSNKADEVKQITVDQTTIGFNAFVQTIGTSEEDVAFTDISGDGVFYMRNLSTQYDVDWGPKSGASMVQMGVMHHTEGVPVIFEFDNAVTLRMVASGGNAEVLIARLNE